MVKQQVQKGQSTERPCAVIVRIRRSPQSLRAAVNREVLRVFSQMMEGIGPKQVRAPAAATGEPAAADADAVPMQEEEEKEGDGRRGKRARH